MENQGDRLETHGKRKVTSQAPCEKARWDLKSTEAFIKICVQEVKAGNRPHTHFTKKGWENIVVNFKQETGRKYSKIQLKNRWDTLKKEWVQWKTMLRGEFGLGWNHIKQTIDANDEWWERKLQILPGCAKFRERGIVLPDDQSMLFNDVYARGDVWISSSGTLPPHMREKEQHDESDDPQTSIGQNDIDNLVVAKKYKDVGTSKDLGEKKKSIATGLKDSLDHFVEEIDHFVEEIEASSATVSSIRRGMPGWSIPEVLKILNNLPGVEVGDDLYMKATNLFLKPAPREMFVALKSDVLRLRFLQMQLNSSQL